MYNVGDFVVYKKDVCKILDIRKNHINNVDYYIFSKLDDPSLKLDVPINNSCNYIRNLITKDEVLELINRMPSIEVVKSTDKLIENEYKVLMASGTHEDLIKIIKTTYLRNKERKDTKKKISEKDDYYFNKAERYLYTEFSVVLGFSYDKAKEYVLDKLNGCN